MITTGDLLIYAVANDRQEIIDFIKPIIKGDLDLTKNDFWRLFDSLYRRKVIPNHIEPISSNNFICACCSKEKKVSILRTFKRSEKGNVPVCTECNDAIGTITVKEYLMKLEREK